MRRWAASVVLVSALVGATCGPTPGLVARGRQGSWTRVEDPRFVAGPSFALADVVAKGDGYPAWTAVGSVGSGTPGTQSAVAWTSTDGSRWSRNDLDAGGARVSVATAGARRQGRAVVVGSVTTLTGDRDGRIWTSTTGDAWPVVDTARAGMGGPGDQDVTSVAAGPLGFVAAGTDRQGDRVVPAVWTSADGLSWARVSAGADSPFVAGEAIRGLAVGAGGAVAVGTVKTGDDTDGMVWFSADGAAWRTVPLGLAGFTGPATQSVNGVTATSTGFVAIGEDANADRRVAVAWTSTDGITWQRQPSSADTAVLQTVDSTDGIGGYDIAGTGPLIAVGGSGYSAHVWASPDGRKWRADDVPVTATHVESGRVAADGLSDLVLIDGTSLWFRPAGGTWASVATDSTVFPVAAHGASMNPSTQVGDRIVALGYSGGSRVLWTSDDGGHSWAQGDAAKAFPGGSANALTSYGPQLVAAGVAGDPSGQRNLAAVWLSLDAGLTWRREDATNPGFAIRDEAHIFGITAGGPGLVAVGLSYADGGTIHAQIWSSVDGRAWQRAADPPEWSGPGDRLFNLVCPLAGGGMVALGTTTEKGNQDVWAWVSSDGLTWTQATGPGTALLGGTGLQHANACARTATGLLVTGFSHDIGAAWSTTDGLTWTAVGGPTTFAPTSGMYGIAADGSRVVVTGDVGDDLAVFTSADAGATWTARAAASFGGFGEQIGHPFLAGGNTVLVGEDGPGAGVWIGPAP